jgi:hypothetical protein
VTSSLFNVTINSQFNGLQYTPAGVYFAVDGTAYPGAPNPPVPANNDGVGLWTGFASGIAGGLQNEQDGLWDSVCIGYAAATIPMWPSVQAGRATLVAQIQAYVGNYVSQTGSLKGLVVTLGGYSQGSMVTDQVWVLDILAETGVLHELLPYVYRSYQFGHIFRSPGIAWGNALAGLPQSIIQDGVETGGIGTGLDLTVAQTNVVAPDGQPVVKSSANSGDIYTCCSVGLNPWTAPAPQGKVGYLFEQIIMQPTLADLISTAEVLEEPIQAIEELFHVMEFFAEGTSAPHYEYWPQQDACIGEMVTLGNSLPHSGA